MNDDKKVKRSIFGFGNYLIYFLASALMVTVVILVAVNPDRSEDVSSVRHRAILGLVIMLTLALVMTLINGLWRNFTIGRPVKRILNATEKLTKGDFSVRIEPFHGFESINELDAIISNFNVMAAELSSVESIQTDFIANVSHELKTPLAIIQNYATMLQDSEISTDDRQLYATRITEATKSLSILISNILKLNKLDNQQIALKKDTYLLNEQLASVLINFESLWENKELDIQTELDEDIMITNDREMLELVWNNIISNAIKFSNSKGTISVKVKKYDYNKIFVSISDEGIGMTKETIDRIFDKFYQGDLARSSQGNGLGLSLVKRVVDLLDGEIRVESNLGSTFTIIFPE